MDRVETVERVLQEWARGNWRAGGDLLTDDAIVSWQEPPADLVVGRGAEDVARKLALFLEQWQEFRVEALKVEPLDEDAVIAHARQIHVGKTSGARAERDTWIVWTFDGERVTQIRWNWDRDLAIEQAGVGGR